MLFSVERRGARSHAGEEILMPNLYQLECQVVTCDGNRDAEIRRRQNVDQAHAAARRAVPSFRFALSGRAVWSTLRSAGGLLP